MKIEGLIERGVRLSVYSPLCRAKQLPLHTPQWETGGLLSEKNGTQEALDSELPLPGARSKTPYGKQGDSVKDLHTPSSPTTFLLNFRLYP